MRFESGQRVHLIGVGGFGISAIARVLLERGYDVSGSDAKANTLTEALARDGATIYSGHDVSNVTGADIVIATSAVDETHVEVKAAREAGLPVYRRRDVLQALLENHRVIAVAGTHGKTTTTSMIVHIMREAGRDPSYIVGGVLASTGTNAGVGTGDVFVIEADEYDHMFLGIQPNVAVLTSLEYDHPDFFESEAAMQDVFKQFVEQIQPGGTLVACADYLTLHPLMDAHHAHGDVVSYGVRESAAMEGHNLRTEDGATDFDLHIITGGTINVNLGTVSIPLWGEHNVLNALAAMTAADLAGVVFQEAQAALSTFQSTGRRFEVRGTADDVVVVDDYAHHPTAIRMTLAAARARYPDRTIWAVWQPHMYSRTQQLIDDYAGAFGDADYVLVTAIYAAREAPIPGVDSAWTAGKLNHPDARGSGGLNATADLLLHEVQPGSVILIMSAGDAPQVGARFLEAYRAGAS